MRTLLTILMFSAVACAQVKHAAVPRPVQCRADAQAWIDYDSYRKATFETLQSELNEIFECDDYRRDVDEANRVIYRNTILVLTDEQHARLMHFITRHKMSDIFIREDQAGLR